MINCYAPWCGHCKKLAPEYAKLADHLKDHPQIIIAKVNCDNQRNLCTEYKVKGYPTILIINNLEESENKLSTYNGNQTAEDMENFLFEKEKKLLKQNKLLMIYFYIPSCENCKALAPEYEALANKLKDHPQIIIAKVDCDEQKNLCTQYSISEYPTILIINNLKGSTKKLSKLRTNQTAEDMEKNLIRLIKISEKIPEKKQILANNSQLIQSIKNNHTIHQLNLQN